MSKRADFDSCPSFSASFDTLVEFGSIRYRKDGRSFLDGLGGSPIQRAGRRRSRNIMFGRPMVLGDCAAQEMISPLFFTVVDYGDLAPMSGASQWILRSTQKEGRTKSIRLLHLDTALVQSEASSNWDPHPHNACKSRKDCSSKFTANRIQSRRRSKQSLTPTAFRMGM